MIRSDSPAAPATSRKPDPTAPAAPPTFSAFERLILAFIAGVILFIGVRLTLGPEETLAFLFYDDAYYYLGVARNLALSGTSTFDGINATNGYHPLWCWILVPVFWALPHLAESGTAVRTAALLWFLLAAAAPIGIVWLLRPAIGTPGTLFAAGFFGLHPYLANGLARPSGLETPLYAVAILAFLLAFGSVARSPASPAPRRRIAGLGLLLGVVILARLDGVFLALAAAILLGLQAHRTRGLGAAFAQAGLLAAGASLLVAPVLAWNVVKLGHPMPVSGRVLSLRAQEERASLDGPFSAAYARRRAGYAIRGMPLLIAGGAVKGTPWEGPIRRSGNPGGFVLLAGFLGATGAFLAGRRRSLSADPLALLTLFAGVHFAGYAAWLWTSEEEWYRIYYFMPETLLVACVAGALWSALLRRTGSPGWVRGGLTAAAIALMAAYALEASARTRSRYAAEPGPVYQRHIYGWVRENLPPGAVLGARDAGKLGFFSGFQVVNLDGLINDQRLIEAIARDTEHLYIASSPIDYLLFDRPWVGPFEPGVVPDTLPPGPSLALTLTRLESLPGVALREIPGAPPDWVVFQVIREGSVRASRSREGTAGGRR